MHGNAFKQFAKYVTFKKAHKTKPVFFIFEMLYSHSMNDGVRDKWIEQRMHAMILFSCVV